MAAPDRYFCSLFLPPKPMANRELIAMRNLCTFFILTLALNAATFAISARAQADDSVTPLTACGTLNPHSHVQEIKCPLSAFQGRKPVDILWVVDNSGSMSSHQQNLINNTSAFINQLIVGNAPKWKLGLISTDTLNAPYLGFTPTTLLDYLTVGAVATFQHAVSMLGTSGDSTEKTFDTVKGALDTYPGFLRPEANLAVITLSDTDDQSTMSVADFVTYMKNKKGGDIKKVAGFGILAAPDIDIACSGEFMNFHGGRYEQWLNASGGKLFSLCQASSTLFADMMQAVLNTVLNNRLFLGVPNIDPATLYVLDSKKALIRGPASAGGEWEYDALKNEIVFSDISKIVGDHFQVIFKLIGHP